jgi:PAS domain S-box-containing protein
MSQEKVNILLVDDQPAKLLSYGAILSGLGENLIEATSGHQALEVLLRTDVAIVLIDVCMPDLDGFQLAAMIREHPRFQKTAIIFISAIYLSEMDRLRGYEMGAVDYVPVPIVPEVLRAKVKVFAELYRKTRELERLNTELEHRVAARTQELEASTAQLLKSEQRRALALAAGNMGSWDWDLESGEYVWDEGQYRIFGVDPKEFLVTPENIRPLIHPDDWAKVQTAAAVLAQGKPYQSEFRILRRNSQIRWCIGSAAATVDRSKRVVRVSGVTIDITERKEAEERQAMLAREIDHRAKNALALVQSIIRLTRSENMNRYVDAVEGRISALARAHSVLAQSRWQGAALRGLVEDELAPYRTEPEEMVRGGPNAILKPAAAQSLALALHELVTNAAKYGALSSRSGHVDVSWAIHGNNLVIQWVETGGPQVKAPAAQGFGSLIIIAGIEKQLGGRVTFEWQPTGLRCTLSIPKESMSIREPTTPLAPASQPVVESFKPINQSRIMIVEDEALVALALAESLSQLGFSVVGPLHNLNDAELAVTQSAIDGAILDVNLNGRLVYPLADKLVERKVPFVFMTGYGADNIDARFKEVPVLHKPIEQDTLRRVLTVNGRPGESSVPPAHVVGADHVAGGFMPKGGDPPSEAPEK